jgi:hypothetical protein
MLVQQTSRLFAFTARVTTKCTSRSKFAKFVADHILSNKYLDVLFAVVNHKRMANKLGNNRTGSSPGLDGFFLAAVFKSTYFGEKLVIDKRTFFLASAHISLGGLRIVSKSRRFVSDSPAGIKLFLT